MTLKKYAKAGDFDGVKALLDSSDKSQLMTAFAEATTDFRTVKRKASHQDIAKLCIDSGLLPDDRVGWMNIPAVCWAAMYGNRDVVDYFRSMHSISNLFAAACIGDIELLQEAKDKLAEFVDENGFNLLHYVAMSALGNADDEMAGKLSEVCTLLLDQGVDPQKSVFNTIDLYPAFLCAWFGGSTEIMDQLIAHGGLTDDQFPCTLEFSLEPHQRSGEPYYDIAALLLAKGFDVNVIRKDQGRTVLHGCANRGTLKPVAWLLENGADVQVCDVEGRTPLHVACERNTSIGVVELLIQYGAELQAKDSEGFVPLDYAVKNKRVKVIEYIEQL